ncbi:MAG: hypothetical protein GTN51_10830, partial [Armatimonadetes bacterium]|nr:hypothetical protein [Armatimonadota bacterium]
MELARAARLFPNVGEAARQFIDMLKRHAEVVCAVLKDQIKLHSEEFLSGILPLSSLLAMIGQREHLGESEEGPVESMVTAAGIGQNVFRRDGEKWTATFNGVTKHFNDTKGMRYVHFLIQHRSREFHVLELARDVDGLPLPDVTHSQMRTEEEGIPFASRTSQRELMDDDYEAAVQEKVKELQEKRDLAETMGDEDAVSAAQDELEQYLSSLASGIGRGGRHREFTDEGERARQRISKA